ncbi:acyl-coenzyme A diphosphatase NUDT19-like isoform X2 [Condylostylus longicornis]|nr:acyl-coenzyme A diphosphatase NUDT19-like isoform X2 [Condylostylus longicornis]
MSGSACFPGGAIDKNDESKKWINHFNKYGISENQLQQNFKNKGNRPPIFKNNFNAIDREISLRINAIRETFEEVGVLLCRKKSELDFSKSNGFGNFHENFDRIKWQEVVHNDASRFLELCETLDVVPDVWNLSEWSDWLTPASFSARRFETAFFIVMLNTFPNVHGEPHEVKNIYWDTPERYFDMHKSEKLWIPPPQFYELKKLSNFHSIDDIINLVKKRSNEGLTLFLPVNYACKDGMVAVMPGDDMYPDNPNDQTSTITVEKTMEEFRKTSKNLHRSEYGTFYDTTFHMNIEPLDGYVFPKHKRPKL